MDMSILWYKNSLFFRSLHFVLPTSLPTTVIHYLVHCLDLFFSALIAHYFNFYFVSFSSSFNMHLFTKYAITALLGPIPFVSAQTYSDCNPLKGIHQPIPRYKE